MKRFLKIIAVAVAACGTISMAACGGTVNYKAGTSPNWDARVVIRNDLTEDSEWLTRKEVAKYDVTFEQGNNAAYKIEYSTDGASYVTSFYAKQYDWSRESIPESYRAANTTEYVYVYETQAIISGKVICGDDTHAFDNNITTVSYFRSAQDNLQPVYSKQVIKCTTPANLAPPTISSAYIDMDCEYETFYNLDCTKAKVICKDNANPDKSGTTDAGVSTKYSLFDVNSLDAALRSLTFSGTHVFDIFIPIEGKNFTYQASCSSATALDTTDENDKKIFDALSAANSDGYLFMGENGEGKLEFKYNALTLSYVSSMPGSSSVYWYANVSDTRLNATRAALLKIKNPVPFDLGTLTYSLSSLTVETI